MITPQGPQVLEFNVRFGDPETQVVLPLLESDLVGYSCGRGRTEAVADVTVRWKKKSSLCVVLASGGYPGASKKGKPFKGLTAKQARSVQVFHAGTQLGRTSDGDRRRPRAGRHGARRHAGSGAGQGLQSGSKDFLRRHDITAKTSAPKRWRVSGRAR